jgi:hypothetical protein
MCLFFVFPFHFSLQNLFFCLSPTLLALHTTFPFCLFPSCPLSCLFPTGFPSRTQLTVLLQCYRCLSLCAHA